MKKKRFLLLFLVLVLAVLFLYEPILRGLGHFMAPQGGGQAEAVVVEGDQVVREGAVRAGVAIIKEGRAKQIILVLHRYSEKEQLFAIQDKYQGWLEEELEGRGLRKNQYRIWVLPINGHPITLSEARYVVPRLFQAGIHRAFLFCLSFHTRRSLLVYQNQGDALGVRFIPYPYFPSYGRDKWWRETLIEPSSGSSTNHFTDFVLEWKS
ncbi:MAG: hypothetical protein WA974_07720, partial [Thermodesulfobacteriota bacterium]